MREMTTGEVREVQLSTLDSFSEFCQVNGIEYQLAYGSLLGSVRHGGYIPWDDDIDVMMLREHYERLRDLLKTEDLLGLRSGIPGYNDWPLPYVKMWDRRTKVIEATELELDCGVGIDIWPLDTAPRHGVAAKARMMESRALYSFEVLAAVTPRPDHSVLKRFVLRLAQPVLKLIGPSRIAAFRDRRAASAKGDLVGVFVGSYPWTVDWDAIFPTTLASYCDRMVPVAADYKMVLGVLYGSDFMEIPPLVDRVSRHKGTAFWMTH